jgi:drug/metabolite transporter (DMT)-like permease
MIEHLSRKGLLNLFVVYTVWSSTYLAIRIAVDPANGFPPFWMGASRMVVAAIILLAFARFQGESIKPSRGEIATLAVAGILLWVFGNGFVLWAEQYADSGFACLMVSSAPIWATIIELIIYRKKTTASLLAALVMGFGGVAVLTLPSLMKGVSADFLAVVALVLSAVCWGLGSVVQTRRPVKLSSQVMSGYHHLFASLGFLVMALLAGEPFPHPTAAAWLSWGYLIVFGSVFAFTAYIVALKLLPISIAMTYAYVNPVLALVLGWLVLGESVTGWTLLGAGLVIVSVVGIFKAKQGPTTGNKQLCENNANVEG